MPWNEKGSIQGPPGLDSARTFKGATTNTAGTYSNQWTKIADVRLTTQYADATANLILLSAGSGQGSPTGAELTMRVKQQAAMGGSPVVSLTVSNLFNITVDSFKLVLDTNNATETVVSLWIKVQVSWETVRVFERAVTNGNLISYYTNGAFQVAAPSGITIWDASKGESGNWYTGTSAPISSAGNIGDFHLRTDTGDFWEKTGPLSWTSRGNLRGPQGLKGDTGAVGATGPQGTPGIDGMPTGNTSQYWRGDKTWQALNSGAVGLGNVNNTADANKPLSTPQKVYLKRSTETKWGLSDPKARIGEALMNMATKRFVMVNTGSSTAAGGTVTDPNQSWFPRVCAMFGGNQNLDSTVTTATVPATGFYGVSFAAGGTLSSNHINADDIAKINSLDPQLIQIMVGSNDWSSNVLPATYKATVKSQVEQFIAARPDVVVTLVHQQARWDGPTRTYPWSAYGQMMKEIVEELPYNCLFLNIDETFKFLGIPSTDLWEIVVGDNTHLGPAGNKILADTICEFYGFPSTRLLGSELYYATSFAGGTYSGVGPHVAATLYIPQKPYRRDLVATTTAYVYATSGQPDIILASTLPDRNVAARVTSATPTSTTVTTATVVPANTPCTLSLVPSTPGSAGIYLSSNTAFMSLQADLRPGIN